MVEGLYALVYAHSMLPRGVWYPIAKRWPQRSELFEINRKEEEEGEGRRMGTT